ncbi:hypothetical protein ACJRO7_024966 [Eucalyptus globulus]|uniref:Transmembrane protein n=1 Tax=Eucalyptus globulus TaxID=34317 RepID=A0ABD3KBV3_EUCGL
MGSSKPISVFFLCLIFFAAALSPLQPCDAIRITERGLATAETPICPACVCCSPPPPGSCCACCATPIETQSTTGPP